MNRFKINVLLIFLLLQAFGPVFAQSNNTRPKIGLTLAGGGAKGLAHIGILEAIDSAGLRIDAITGTSMGSIIGALYAAGYSGEAIEKIGRKLDWDLMFSTTPKLNSISIERKDEYNKYAIEVPFENGKFKIRKGFIEGQELWLKFAELFEPVYYINDFSKFPIPFKCIGTDLETGNPVVMDHGDITTCVRASMAIPSVFTPVPFEGKTLVDGGVVNNFPVLDVKEMGAAIVIGVNLSKGLEKAENLKSPVDILLQICSYKDAEHFPKHREACDIYILPDLKNYSSASFSASDSIIDIGKRTAKRYYPVFKRLADSLNALYPEESFEKNRLPKNNSVIINDYTVEGLKHTKENFFFGLLDLNHNEVYSSKKVAESVRRVYSSLYYSKINFGFSHPDSGKNVINFKVEESPLTSVKSGISFSTFSSLGLKFNITSYDLLFKESHAIATINVSGNPRLYLEYFKFLGQTRTYGINVSYYNENIDYPIFEDFRKKDNLRSRYSQLDLRIQHNISKNNYLAFGQQFINSRIHKPESQEIVHEGINSYLKTYISYVLNSVDKKYFTTKGWKTGIECGFIYNQAPDLTSVTSDETVTGIVPGAGYNNHIRLFLKADHYNPVNSRLVFSQNATVAYLIDNNPYITNKFLVGGISDIMNNQVTFAGLDESEIKTGSIAAVKLSLQYALSKNNYLTGRVNAALYDFQKAAGKITTANNLLTGYGLTYGYDSAIGPIEFSAMYCDQDGIVRYSMSLGFSF